MTIRDGLLAELVEQGVDEKIARTLLDYAAVVGENMRLKRENERLTANLRFLHQRTHGATCPIKNPSQCEYVCALAGDHLAGAGGSDEA